jgi:thiol-disulfide isomerase/thioredoxin
LNFLEELPELIGATTWINGEVTKQDLIGEKPSLVHFWSVSCYLCREAISEINVIRDECKDDLNVLAVHIPRSEDDLDLSEIEQMVNKLEMTHSNFVDSELKLTDTFANKYVPAYYIFDKKGKLFHYQAGGSGIQLLKKKINRIVGEK